MITDEIKVTIKAGRGGAGKVAFNSIPRSLGPTGGNGGRGGSIFVEGVSDLSALRQFRFKKEFEAEDGGAGGAANREGRAGEDLVLKVPIGTVVHVVSDLTNRGEDADVTLKIPTISESVEVTQVGQKELLAKGGKGGKGNFEFRSSRKTSPTYAQPGLPGEEFQVFLELRLIADAGLIGLPNAGKSSLLNELTPAGVKVANYPFTTLEPNLGAYWPKGADYEKDKPIILADIPGLIEGASSGKGLGIKFLRHIQRTRVLLHCIAGDSTDPLQDYQTVREELEHHDIELSKKEEYILLTKSDLLSDKDIKKKLTVLKKLKRPVQVVSVHNEEQLAQLKELLDALE